VNKYGARSVERDGFRFASQAEFLRYCDLRTLERSRQISNLEVHPRFRIAIGGKPICEYVADFRYLQDGVRVVEDVKGVRTAVYVLKKKLMSAVLGIFVREVAAGDYRMRRPRSSKSSGMSAARAKRPGAGLITCRR